MHRQRATISFVLLSALLVAVACAAVLYGAMPIPMSSLTGLAMEAIGLEPSEPVPSGHRYIIVHLRLPRAICAILIGAALSVAGAMMQGLFRNPLADPGLLGVSSGAALGAAMVIVLGFTLPVFPLLTLPISAFTGGVLATIIVMRLSFRGRVTNVANMLLAGIAINAICGAGTGLLVYISDDEQLRSLTFWTMGSVGGASWNTLPYVLLFAFAPALVAIPLAKSINALLLGESEAHLLGVNVEHLKLLIIVLVCIMVGTSVSLTGIRTQPPPRAVGGGNSDAAHAAASMVLPPSGQYAGSSSSLGHRRASPSSGTSTRTPWCCSGCRRTTRTGRARGGEEGR